MTDAAASTAPAADASASVAHVVASPSSTPAIPASASTATPAATSTAPVATSTASPAPATTAPVAAPAAWVPAVPQGSPLDAAYVKSISDLAVAKGIPAAQAQAFLEHQHAQALGFVQQAQAERTAWEAELKADPKIGGEKFTQTIQEVDRSLDKLFGTQATAFREILKNTGYGSNPTVVRALAHATNLLRDDSFSAGAGNQGKPSEDQMLALRYPLMKDG